MTLDMRPSGRILDLMTTRHYNPKATEAQAYEVLRAAQVQVSLCEGNRTYKRTEVLLAAAAVRRAEREFNAGRFGLAAEGALDALGGLAFSPALRAQYERAVSRVATAERTSSR